MEKFKLTIATFICMGKDYWHKLDDDDQLYLRRIFIKSTTNQAGLAEWFSDNVAEAKIKEAIPCFFED